MGPRGARDDVAVQVKFDQDAGVLRVTMTGRIDLAQVQAAWAGLEPGVAPRDADLLCDARQLDYTALDSDTVRALASLRRDGSIPRDAARTALVVVGDLGFGMGRMYEMRTDGVYKAFRIFRDLDEAERWLRSGED